MANSAIDGRVVFCGVARDCARTITQALFIADKITWMFRERSFLFYENDSMDDTRAKLSDFCARRNALLLPVRRGQEWVNYQDGKPYRPEQIAYARNVVMETADKIEADYMIWMDMDFFREPDYDGIRSCFERDDWDGVFANGVDPEGRFWDWFALRDDRFPFGTETMGDEWYKLKRPHHFLGTEWHPVYSAFGGMAIYRKPSINGCRYSASVTLPVVELNRRLGSTGWTTHQGVGPLPSMCEHVGLHAEMIARGKSRLFINPAMIFRY